MFRYNRQTYTQAEIKMQQGIVAEAIAQRNDIPSGKHDDYVRASTSVECAQEILNFMLEEVISSHKK